MISGLIKVEESVISFIIHWFMENIQKLLREMQANFICASKNTRTNAPISSHITRNQALAKGALRMRTARGIICGYNWIKDFTIIMLVHKITRILKVSRGLLANKNADSESNV